MSEPATASSDVLQILPEVSISGAESPRAEIDAVIKEAFQECHGTYPVPRYYTRPAARALLEQVCAE